MSEGEWKEVPYNQFFDLCEKAGKRHGDVLDLPYKMHPYEYVKRIYMKEFKNGRILDFGCGAKKPLQSDLKLSDDNYKTCDNDPCGTFTYPTPIEIPENEMFEIITANHVFEHLTFIDGLNVAAILVHHIKLGGVFQISVPNPKHPTRYLSSPVHVTPWNYQNLCALMELVGIDPFYCARYSKRPAPFILIRPFINSLCKTFMMDWCDSIYVVGRSLK